MTDAILLSVVGGWQECAVERAPASRHALIITGAFVCSGVPMIVGSLNRYLRRQQDEIEARREAEERFLKEARVHIGDAVRLLNGRNPIVTHCLSPALLELGIVSDAHKEFSEIDE